MNRAVIVIVAAVALVGACSTAAVVVTPAPSPAATPSVAAPQVASPVTSASLAPTPAPTTRLDFVPGTKANPRIVKVTADDQLTFSPNVITVAQGETVSFAVTNSGKAAHEFMLGPAADAIADKEGTPEIADILAGTTKTLTFTFDGTGPYALACHEPGHFEAGMFGYIVVVGPGVPPVGTVAQPRLVEVDMSDELKFAPSNISVAKGETVTFLVTNLGTAVHEFAIGPAAMVDADEIDGTIVKEADEIGGGHMKTVTYTFDGSGPYGFACHETGHFEAGMKGTITFGG